MEPLASILTAKPAPNLGSKKLAAILPAGSDPIGALSESGAAFQTAAAAILSRHEAPSDFNRQNSGSFSPNIRVDFHDAAGDGGDNAILDNELNFSPAGRFAASPANPMATQMTNVADSNPIPSAAPPITGNPPTTGNPRTTEIPRPTGNSPLFTETAVRAPEAQKATEGNDDDEKDVASAASHQIFDNLLQFTDTADRVPVIQKTAQESSDDDSQSSTPIPRQESESLSQPSRSMRLRLQQAPGESNADANTERGPPLSTKPTDGSTARAVSNEIVSSDISVKQSIPDVAYYIQSELEAPTDEPRMSAETRSTSPIKTNIVGKEGGAPSKAHFALDLTFSGNAHGLDSRLQIHPAPGADIRALMVNGAHSNPPLSVIETISHKNGFELRLDPPDLGRVTIEFAREDDKIVRAIVSADNPQTLDLARRHADTLARELDRQGFTGLDLQFSDQRDADRARQAQQDAQTANSSVTWMEAPPQTEQPPMHAITNDRYDRLV